MKPNDHVQFSRACIDLQEITGKVSASVTHEIKNQLTVIKEQAGLLQDLSLLAAKNGSMDIARVQSLSERIAARVHQADAIVKRFNAFAHSSDEALGAVEAGEALDLMVRLYQRLADRAMVELAFREPDRKLEIATRPLFLLSALFACLEAAVRAAPENSRVEVWAEEMGPEVGFGFSWQGELGSQSIGPGAELMAVLGGRVQALRGQSGFKFSVPRAPAGPETDS